jgi:hypothetical protein
VLPHKWKYRMLPKKSNQRPPVINSPRHPNGPPGTGGFRPAVDSSGHGDQTEATRHPPSELSNIVEICRILPAKSGQHGRGNPRSDNTNPSTCSIKAADNMPADEGKPFSFSHLQRKCNTSAFFKTVAFCNILSHCFVLCSPFWASSVAHHQRHFGHYPRHHGNGLC